MRNLILLLLLLYSTRVWAEGVDAAKIDQRAQNVYDTTMSPYCPGRTLSACPSADAKKLREDIYVWLSQGTPEEEVRTRLVSQFGDDVRGAPQGKGVGLLAWIIPGLFVLLGFVLLGRFVVRRETKEETQDDRAAEPELHSYRERIEAELKQRLSRGE